MHGTSKSSNSLLDRLRRRGWPLTAQRRTVAEVLDGDHVHLTAEEVHDRAVRRLPEISRATVYNVLGELVTIGEVSEVKNHGRAKRYDPNARDPHHHLCCDRCGRILDVHPQGTSALRLPPAERHGFAIGNVNIVFHGVCASCKAAG